MEEIFKRSSNNPIITLNDLPFNIHAVLNPGATEFGNEIILLIRVEHSDGISNIHVARSKNGVDGWQIEYTPILEKGENWHYEEWGCEDARITYLPDKAAWYITYTAYSSAGAAVGLACTRDFVSAERVGLIFSPNNKDAVLFPTKFNGNYAVLHRPDAGGIQNIWIAFSPDLKFWGEPHAVLLEGGGPAWNGVKVGSGPPPVETKEGWLLLFHGAKYYGNNLVYRTGAVLLEKDKPHKIKAILPYSIFSSKEPYEMTGLMPNVLFPTGLLLRGDELWLYYGAADSSICLATVKLQALLNLFE
jgi:beta-1,4-mannooligosaccharide/beta-1,4-mannosyl-N-acetylglucosamine phosphorylase